MEDLRTLGPGVAALYTLVGEEKYRVIVVTPAVRKAAEYPITAKDLRTKVAAFSAALQDPKADPLPLAKELYQIVLGPVVHDLEDAGVQTLMWALDDVLRYIPMAALHDGRQYLVEHYQLEVFTPASPIKLATQPPTVRAALGVGVAKAHPNFPALPAVPSELCAIIHEEALCHAKGVLPGKILLDEAFTEEHWKTALRQGYPVVHIASHFRLAPGDEDKSALLLGDGTAFSLTQLKTSQIGFRDVDLLTLSACNTATVGLGVSGAEVEGFGVLAQKRGARTVVASLWEVPDQGSKVLMETFYRFWGAHPGLSKIEALRQAQIRLLHGEQQASYMHPHYWAPFILVGDWR
jgi:CHAT domain-containing protein